VLVVEIEAGVFDGHACGCHGELGEARHAAAVFAVHVLRVVEVRYLPRDLAGVGTGVGPGHRPDAAVTGDGVRPELLHSASQWSHHAQARDYAPAAPVHRDDLSRSIVRRTLTDTAWFPLPP